MARGDGGKNVFEEDNDCFAWTGLLEKGMEGLDGGRRNDEKEMVAALVRSCTGVTNRWVAAPQSMGHEVSVTRAVRCFREDPKAARKLKALARKLGSR